MHLVNRVRAFTGGDIVSLIGSLEALCCYH